MKILFITPYPNGQVGSQRFRFEQYYQLFTKLGVHYTTAPFFEPKTQAILYKQGHYFAKIQGTLAGYVKRIGLLFALPQYDHVFIHREAAPLGPPIFEFLARYVWGKKFILDFDDAIWLPHISPENKGIKSLKNTGKTASLCKWAGKVSVGNDFLARYARQYNKAVHVLPTVVSIHPAAILGDAQNPTIGWTGTHSTLPYLLDILPLLDTVHAQSPFRLLVICDQMPPVSRAYLNYKPWNAQTEIADLQEINIGLMPLPAGEWSEGKCGFKAIQYMALGIPTLASVTEANRTIVVHGENGYLCTTPDEWITNLLVLLRDDSLRNVLGKKAQEHIRKNFTPTAHEKLFLSLFGITVSGVE